MADSGNLTVRDMHVEVITQLQRQGAYKKDATFEEWIDLRLNTAQTRLLKSKVIPNPKFPAKFMVDSKTAADIQSIIVPNKKLRVFKDTNTRGYVCLPNDFKYLVNDRSGVIDDCESSFSNPTEEISYQARVFQLVDSALSAGPYYKTIKVTKNTVDYSLNYVGGIISKKEKSIFIEPILELFNKAGYAEVYWENYDNIHRPQSFIVIVETLSDNIGLTLDSTSVTPEIISITKTRYKDLANTKEASNRCYKSDFVHDAIKTKYMRPLPDSPVTTPEENKLFVFTTEKFLVSGIFIDYIREPRRISLPLNRSCEMRGVHDEICDIAVELMLRDIEAGNYPLKTQDNVLRSQQ